MANDGPLTVGSVIFEDNYPKPWFSSGIRCFPTIVVISQATTGNTLLQCGCPGPPDGGQATSPRLGSLALATEPSQCGLADDGGSLLSEWGPLLRYVLGGAFCARRGAAIDVTFCFYCPGAPLRWVTDRHFLSHTSCLAGGRGAFLPTGGSRGVAF